MLGVLLKAFRHESSMKWTLLLLIVRVRQRKHLLNDLSLVYLHWNGVEHVSVSRVYKTTIAQILQIVIDKLGYLVFELLGKVSKNLLRDLLLGFFGSVGDSSLYLLIDLLLELLLEDFILLGVNLSTFFILSISIYTAFRVITLYILYSAGLELLLGFSNWRWSVLLYLMCGRTNLLLELLGWF